MFAHPFLRASFKAAEVDGLAPDLAELDHRRQVLKLHQRRFVAGRRLETQAARLARRLFCAALSRVCDFESCLPFAYNYWRGG
jgi:hypothetical protein